MITFVGIDEAGYGPTIGPLVLGMSSFRAPEKTKGRLFQHLAPVISRTPEEHPHQIPVNDSKKLYAGRKSLAPLELGALAFLNPDGPLAENMSELPGMSEVGALAPWYRVAPTSPELPVAVSPPDRERARALVRRRLPDLEVELTHCRVLPVLEETLNRSLQRTQNKAASLMSFVAQLVLEAVERSADDQVEIFVDRLGGRRYYHSFLASMFPFRAIRILSESPTHSCYELRESKRRFRFTFATESDAHYMPVALASMCAKYVRELFLRRLNHHFSARLPGLKPTAGYPKDAARFLDDIAPLLPAKERQLLIRML